MLVSVVLSDDGYLIASGFLIKNMYHQEYPNLSKYGVKNTFNVSIAQGTNPFDFVYSNGKFDLKASGNDFDEETARKLRNAVTPNDENMLHLLTIKK